MIGQRNRFFDKFIRHALYPVLLVFIIGYAFIEISGPDETLGQYYPYYLGLLLGTMLCIEILRPLRTEWRMTRTTFFRRDLPFLLISGATIFLVQLLAGWFIIWFGLIRGVSHNEIALLPSIILIILTVDFLWYWVHRWSHEGRDPVAHWLWRIHVAHHLPQQVYLLMHAVSHPFNVVIVKTLFTVPLFFIGFSTEAVFISNLIIGLQGMVSHFNVDMRAAYFNYLFMGAELHRYHHSANPTESKNYASTIVLWDILFGTYVAKFNAPPQKLGIEKPDQYPTDQEILKILRLPF